MQTILASLPAQRNTAAKALKLARNLRGQAARDAVADVIGQVTDFTEPMRRAVLLIAWRERDYGLVDVAAACNADYVAQYMLRHRA